MSAQEKAGIKALDRHSQKMGIRNGQINCTCDWKTETTGQVNQRKSFRRHQMREVLAAIKDTEEPNDGVLFDLIVDLKRPQGEETVKIRVSGTEDYELACLALHQVGKPEYLMAIISGVDDPEGWVEEAAS